MTDDIVDTLRRNPLYIPTSRINSFGRPQMGFELTSFNLIAADEIERLRKERDEARRYSCDLEARITMLEEDRRDTSNNFGTNPCSEIILPDYPLARDPKEIAKRKGWDCFKEDCK